jgi:hypothetical protein
MTNGWNESMQAFVQYEGLFSEGIGLSGERLGNFPQAFTPSHTHQTRP